MNYMNKVTNIFAKLNGYKTYVVAVVTVLYALGYYGLSQNDWATALSLVLGGSGLGALRHGISTRNVSQG